LIKTGSLEINRSEKMFLNLSPFLMVVLAASAAFAADPVLTETTLFDAGADGHKLYRIPGIVVTKAGTILVYCEARRNTGGDWDTIDLVLRRSTDKGATFSPPQIVGQITGGIRRNPVAIERKQGTPEDVTYNNPVAIADRDGSVHFLFCLEYMRVFYMVSKDDGRTFSKPVEITHAFDTLRPGYNWRVVATGPGHGIQLSSGRLVVPSWVALGTEGNGHFPSADTTIYSNDHGKTWHVKGLAIPDSPAFPSANETVAVELADGSVMLNARSPVKDNRRVITVSKDGENGWSPPHFQADLPDPICMAGLVRFSTKKNGGKNRLLFSNPDNLARDDGRDVVSKDRKNVTVRISYDEGASWPIKRVLDPGPSGYSDLAVLPDGTALCFYEASRNGSSGAPAERLVLARFNLEWLTEGQDSVSKKARK
jgi:sialidase-1